MSKEPLTPPRRSLSVGGRFALGVAALLIGAVGFGVRLLGSPAPITTPDPASELQRETEALVDELLPKVAALNGFPRPQPVRVEVTTRAKLGELALPSVREVYGEDGLKRSARVGAALGLLPDGYDLEAGITNLLLAVMGGGYDPVRDTFYALADLPPQMRQPAQLRLVAAHEVTHALQDQVSDMLAHQRLGASDWDHEFLFNSVVEGAAYLTMMAVTGGTPLDQAADPTDLLLNTQRQMEAAPGFETYAQAPRFLKNQLFGSALAGIAFTKEWLRHHPGQGPAVLLDHLPASGEQVLHYDKYEADDRPAPLDLERVDHELPKAWRPYYAGRLGEHQVSTLIGEVPALRVVAGSVAAGWDGFVFRAFEDDAGRLILVGLSAWDSPGDAAEFRSALEQVLAGRHPAGSFAVEQSGSLVRLVTGVADAQQQRLALNAIAGVEPKA